MTDRQLAILNSAQHLFLERSYPGTSTKAIAKHAKVSEALIFKHFNNKQTLFATVMNRCDKSVLDYLYALSSESESKAILEHVLTMPFTFYEQNDLSLTVLSTLESQQEFRVRCFDVSAELLHQAFKAEFYKSPKIESELALLIITKISRSLFNKTFQNRSQLKELILRKYHIQSE